MFISHDDFYDQLILHRDILIHLKRHPTEMLFPFFVKKVLLIYQLPQILSITLHWHPAVKAFGSKTDLHCLTSLQVFVAFTEEYL
jgi:hypothetical protein